MSNEQKTGSHLYGDNFDQPGRGVTLRAPQVPPHGPSTNNIPIEPATKETLPPALSVASCELDAQGHCITCSDEALSARVLCVDQHTGIARVIINEVDEEVDITLLEEVRPGDLLLVHAGVAIANTESHTARDTGEVRNA